MAVDVAYQRDLRSVPQRLRRPIHRFIQCGVLPVGHADLLAFLGGDLAGAVKLQSPAGRPFIGAAVFIEEHCPDIAYGHPAYVLRWQRMGGLAGPRQ